MYTTIKDIILDSGIRSLAGLMWNVNFSINLGVCRFPYEVLKSEQRLWCYVIFIQQPGRRSHIAGRSGRLFLRVPAEGVADVRRERRAGARHVRHGHAGRPRKDAARLQLRPVLLGRSQVRQSVRGENGPSILLCR